MHVRLRDDFIEADVLLGPMPDFNEPFESFFRRKAADLLSLADKPFMDNDRPESEHNNDSINEAIDELNDLFIVRITF